MAHHLKLANASTATRRLGDWAETETSLDIMRSLELISALPGPAMTMIAGAPGVGKTATLERFTAAHEIDRGVAYIQAAKGEGTAWNFATSMCAIWGQSAPEFVSLSEARQKFARYLRDSILIVDEAQYLDQKNHRNGQTGEVFEWLRAMSETGGCKIVFAGDLALPGAISKMPQLLSRIRRPVVVRMASRADVAAMVEGTSFCIPACLDALHAIAKKPGGLRNVESVTTLAQLFAGDDAPGLIHVKAAIHDMKLGPKGGVK